MAQRKIFIGFSGNFHAYFHSVHWLFAKMGLSQVPCAAGLQYIAPCFCFKLKWSAIIAMNSLFVGLPLMFDTV